VAQGQKIPAKKLAAASHSDNPTLRRRAALAKTLKGMHHKADGGAISDEQETALENLRQMLQEPETAPSTAQSRRVARQQQNKG
jgi:hypothetical protein